MASSSLDFPELMLLTCISCLLRCRSPTMDLILLTWKYYGLFCDQLVDLKSTRCQSTFIRFCCLRNSTSNGHLGIMLADCCLFDLHNSRFWTSSSRDSRRKQPLKAENYFPIVRALPVLWKEPLASVSQICTGNHPIGLVNLSSSYRTKLHCSILFRQNCFSESSALSCCEAE